MARVRDVSIDEVAPDVRPVYERYANEYGPFLNQVKVFAHRGPALKHIMGLLLELADEQKLPKRLLEIAVVAVSKLNACDYCVAHHAPRLRKLGLSEETLERIMEDNPPGFTEDDKLVRDYAVEVTLRPQRIPDELFARLKERFSDEMVVELTLRIALCGFFNRFNDALQIDIEEEALQEVMSARA